SAFLIQYAMAAELPAGHAAVDAVAILAKALPLGFTGTQDLLTHVFAWRAISARCQFLERYGRNLDVQVNTIQQWAADAAEVALDLHRRALASMTGVAEV